MTGHATVSRTAVAVALAAALLGVPTTAVAEGSGRTEPAAASSRCAEETGRAPACRRTRVYGHRCRTWARDSRSNENTLAALRLVARRSPGAGCEIDLWRLADDRFVVFHDRTWTRVVDPATAVGAPRRVADTTWRQVRRMRTNGGERLVTARRFIRAAARLDVPLLVEPKNFVLGDSWGVIAAATGARIRWYQAPSPDEGCTLSMLGAAVRAGMRVGLKEDGRCHVTPRKASALGSFYLTALWNWSRRKARAYREAGVVIGTLIAPESLWADMVDKGARLLVVDSTRRLGRWLGRQ